VCTTSLSIGNSNSIFLSFLMREKTTTTKAAAVRDDGVTRAQEGFGQLRAD
jgi:hypothetical protein